MKSDTDLITVQFIRKGKGKTPQNLIASYEVESHLPFAEAYQQTMERFKKDKCIPEPVKRVDLHRKD